MGSTAYSFEAPDVVRIHNVAYGSIAVSLRLSPHGNDKINEKYRDDVIKTVEVYLNYIKKPSCKVEVYDTTVSDVRIVDSKEAGCREVIHKATGMTLAVIRFCCNNRLFNMALETCVAHATEEYLANIKRLQKAQASGKVMANRRQAVNNLMRR